MHRLGSILLLSTLVACGGSSSPSDAATDVPDGGVDGGTDAALPPPADVTGELRILGCETEPAAIQIRLAGLEAHRETAPRASALGEPPRPAVPTEAPVFEATVSASDEPGAYRFSAPDLPFGLYRIGVDVGAEGCEELVWRGPPSGIVRAGDDLSLTAVALRTHLEVWDEASERWSSGAWVTDDSMERRFRVRTDLPGVVAVDVQISPERFVVADPTREDFCDAPSGAQTERIEVPPAGREMEIDVSSFLVPRVDATPEELIRWRRVRAGAPVYLRAVPITSAGPACHLQVHGASSWVRLIRRERPPIPTYEPGPELHITGTYTPGYYPFPDVLAHDHSCYRFIAPYRLTVPTGPVLPDDFVAAMLVWKAGYPNGYLAMPGERFCVAPSSGGGGGFLDDLGDAFGDFVGTIVDAAEWAVDKAAALYEEIKHRVIDMVAHVIADLTGCEAPCRAALELGAEIALASMGLPPSLPDFDTLVNEGIDYLAAELAAQAGVPDFVAEEALDLAVRMVERANATRGSRLAPWLIEDNGFVQTVMRLDIQRRPGAPVRPRQLFWIPNPPLDVWPARVLSLHLPESGSLHVPVSLQPDIEGLPPVEPFFETSWPAPYAYYGTRQRVDAWYQTRWAEQRISAYGCIHIDGVGVLTDGGTVSSERVVSVDFRNQEHNAFGDPFESQCTP